ncbi:LbetaH domain-containing protein [Porphyromonas somerae]|uniref:hypothetical protein n=1 Tax=Porphyromonas somerae TaxID=322095 RepID=UPI001FCC70B9|nr:hypothetical protein [Porphyromonas somerae]BDE81799.1 hypothetical protein CE91St14_08270 [Porphyromonas somerae]
MEKKYEMLMDDCVSFEYRGAWHKLYRIKALREFGDVSKGDVGGYIEKEDNLSHSGICWVYCDARVFDNARVLGDAAVSGNALIMASATIRDNAFVTDDARVTGGALVCDDAHIGDNAIVSDSATIRGYAKIVGNAKVRDIAIVGGMARVRDNSAVIENAQVDGICSIHGKALICGNAIIDDDSDYIVFKNWWSSGRYFTWTRLNNMWAVGCFYGTGEELIEKAYKDSDISGREYERVVNYVEEILRDGRE